MANEHHNGQVKQDPADGKRLFNMTFKMSKQNGDQTEMTADFMGDVSHYIEYDVAVTTCLMYIDSIFLPLHCRTSFFSKDSKVKPDDDAFLKLQHAFLEYGNHCKKKIEFNHFAGNMKIGFETRKRWQKEQVDASKNMRGFHNGPFHDFTEQKKKFDDSRKRMDAAKAEVGQAKTAAQIEKKSGCYQMAVDDFDAQTDKLIRMVDGLPMLKKGITNDIIAVLEKHKLYHIDISRHFETPK